MKSMNFLVIALALMSTGADWPDFLPNTRLMSVSGDLPIQWSPEQNIAWRIELPGDGQSSPVVYKDRIVVSSVEGDMKDRNLITCFDLTTGNQIWQHTFPTALEIKSSLYVSRAAPTPAADETGVVVLFESSDVIALDWDGNVRWQRALLEEYGAIKAEFGLAASLAQHGPLVYALIENEGPSYLVALDKATGETAWKVDRPSVISWSSPALMTLAGIPQIVISSVGTVSGYDAESGKELWTIGGLGGNTVATPSQVDENRLIVGASPDRGGSNSDVAAKSNLMIEVTARGQSVNAEVVWRTEKAMASFASPLAYRGIGYWVNRAGVVFAVDLSNGKELFAQRIDQAPWATPIGVDDRVYFFGKDGVTTVIRAGEKFEKIAANTLWNPEDAAADDAAAEREETAERRAAAAMFSGPIQYGVAVADDAFIIRSGNRLYRVANK